MPFLDLRPMHVPLGDGRPRRARRHHRGGGVHQRAHRWRRSSALFAEYCGTAHCVGDVERPRRASARRCSPRISSPAPRSSCRPTRSSRPSRRSRRPGSCRCPSTCSRRTTGSIRKRPRAAVGSRTQADHCRCTCTASWRTCASSTRSPSAPAWPSSRTPHKRMGPTATGSGQARRGSPAAFSFYPARTSARWATRAHSSPTTQRSPTRRAPCASTDSGASTPRAGGLHGAARHDPGDLPAPQASAPRRLERRARAEWPRRTREGLAGVGDLRLPKRPDGSTPVWHLYVIRTAEPERLAEFLRERGIGTGRHYPVPPHLSRLRVAGLSGGCFPGQRGAGARVPLAADLPRLDARRRPSAVDRRRTRVLRSVAREPVNDAPYRHHAGRRARARTSRSIPFVNLYGCRIGDEKRRRPVRRDPERGDDRADVQESRATRSSAREWRSGTRSSSATASNFVNDKHPRATTVRWRAAASGRLGAAARGRRERGASIGSGALVLGGVRIGAGALVGAGAVVTHDVEPGAVVSGDTGARARAGDEHHVGRYGYEVAGETPVFFARARLTSLENVGSASPGFPMTASTLIVQPRLPDERDPPARLGSTS